MRSARGEKVTPTLGLKYRSSQRPGVAGVGWDVPLSYVEKSHFGRVPDSPSANISTGALTGEFVQARYTYRGFDGGCQLAHTSSAQYRCRIQRGDAYLSFQTYVLNGEVHWLAKDGNGTLFVFGLTVEAPVQDDLGNGGERWYLTDVVDTNNNWMRINYRGRLDGDNCIASTLVDREVVIESVYWNNKEAPQNLNTRDLGEPRCVEATFRDRVLYSYEPRLINRIDTVLGRVEPLEVRLRHVQVEVRHGTGSWTNRRTYYLGYDPAAVTKRDLLTSITTTSGCPTISYYGHHDPLIPSCDPDSMLPPTTFTYSPGVSALSATRTPVSGPLPDWLYKRGLTATAGQEVYASLLDFDGDGRKDVVTEVYGTAPPNGATAGFETVVAWRDGSTTVPTWSGTQSIWEPRYAPLLTTDIFQDLNGDGRPDVLERESLFLNQGTSFDRNVPTGQPWGFHTANHQWASSAALSYIETNTTFNELESCASSQDVGVVVGCENILQQGQANGLTQSLISRYASLKDMTGDGIVDLTVLGRNIDDTDCPDPLDPPNCYIDPNPTTEWWVFPGYKTGTNAGGFEAAPILWAVPVGSTKPSQTQDSVDSSGNRYLRRYGLLKDVTGDGRPDYLLGQQNFSANGSGRGPTRLFVNVGNGFVEHEWAHDTLPLFTSIAWYASSTSVFPMQRNVTELFQDVNGDGFPDFLSSCGPDVCIEFGTGAGFTAPTLFASAPLGTLLGRGEMEQNGTLSIRYGYADVNDDGLLDYVDAAGGNGSDWDVYLTDFKGIGSTRYPDLLTRIDNGLSAGTSISYTPSSHFPDAIVPSVRPLLATITPYVETVGPAPDGVQFTYYGGQQIYDSFNQSFVWTGFDRVERTTPSKQRTEATFETQDAKRIGLLTRETAFDEKNCPMTQKDIAYSEHLVSGTDVAIVYASLTTSTDYEYGTLDCQPSSVLPLGVMETSSEVLSVNDFGSVLEAIDHGETGSPDDDLCTSTLYASSPSSDVINRPYRVEIGGAYNAASGSCTRTLLATQYTYDGVIYDPLDALVLGQVGRGNIKTVEQELYDLAGAAGVLKERFVSTRYAYDQRGNQNVAIDMFDAINGRKTRLTFDQEDVLVATHIRQGEGIGILPQRILVTSMGYDFEKGVVESETAPNGVKTLYGYDAFGRRLWKEIEDIQANRVRTTEWIYDYVDTNADGELDAYATTTRAYHEGGGYQEQTTVLNGLGQKTETRDTLGVDFGSAELVTTYVYDSRGRLTDEIGPAVEPIAAHPSLQPLRRATVYDQRSRPIRSILSPGLAGVPNSVATQTSVTQNTYVTRIEYGVQEWGLYALPHRKIETYPPFDPAFPHTPGATEPPPLMQLINGKGRRVRSDDRNQRHVLYSYNALGHLTSVQRTLQISGPAHQIVTEIETDALGRVIEIRDPDKGVVRHQYNYFGKPTRSWRAEALTPSEPTERLVMTYDILGRLEEEKSQTCINPPFCTFDDHPDWVDDGKIYSTYYYDEISRLPAPLDVEHPGVGPGKGQLIAVTNEPSSYGGVQHGYVQWLGYDDFGRSALSGQRLSPNQPFGGTQPSFFTFKRIGLDGKTVDWVAGEGTWPGTVTQPGQPDPSGYTQHTHFGFEYNSANYLAQINDPETGDVLYEVDTYDPRGPPSLVFMNDQKVSIDLGHDPVDGRLLSIHADALVFDGQTFVPGSVLDLSYSSFDASGNILEIGDARTSSHYTFAYDPEGQLATAKASQGVGEAAQTFDLAYSYGPLGGLRSVTDHLDPSRNRNFFFPDDGTRPQTLIGIDDPTAMVTYPVQHELGRLVSRLGDTYSYAPDDRLLSVTRSNGSHVTLEYVAGRRVRKVVSGAGSSLDRFYVAKGLAVDWTTPSDPKLEVSLHVNDVPILERRIEVNTQLQSDSFFIADHLGSIRSVLDEQGQETDYRSFYPFGALQQGSVPQSYGYTGHIHDGETDLVYMNARYYDPSLGRFMSGDTIVPDSTRNLDFNRYAYAYNNPIGNTDPSGRNPVAALVFGGLVAFAKGLTYYTQLENPTFGDFFVSVVVGTAVGAGMAWLSYHLPTKIPGLPAHHTSSITRIFNKAVAGGVRASITNGISRLVVPKLYPRANPRNPDPDHNPFADYLLNVGLSAVSAGVTEGISGALSVPGADRPQDTFLSRFAAATAGDLVGSFTRNLINPQESTFSERRVEGDIVQALVVGLGTALLMPPTQGDGFADDLRREFLHEAVRVASIYTRGLVNAAINEDAAGFGEASLGAGERFDQNFRNYLYRP